MKNFGPLEMVAILTAAHILNGPCIQLTYKPYERKIVKNLGPSLAYLLIYVSNFFGADD